MNGKLIKATASGIVLGAALMGCATTTPRSVASSSSAPSGHKQAVAAQEQAKTAMQKGDIASALASMERAVEFAPNDAGYRKTLAELYLRTGRFASAETTYGDVVRLNPTDAKASFFVAVAQLGQGRIADALVRLESAAGIVEPADLGLAYALVGQTQRALSLLVPASRGLDANSRIRQNLAVAYALAGDWKSARVTAMQDLSPSEANRRLQQWAALASSSDPEVRVATMLGVARAAADPGQPQRLALAPQAGSTGPVEQAAAVGPVEAPVPAPVLAAPEPVPAPAEVAQHPAPAAPAPIEVAAAPVLAPVTPAVQKSPVRPSIARPAALPTARTQVRNGPTSRLVVQVGAYRAPAQVERAWDTLNRRFTFLARYQPLSTSVTLNGRGLFHRLSIAGFESDSAAVNACRAIKAQGGSCFVRAIAGDAPVQWASRSTRKA